MLKSRNVVSNVRIYRATWSEPIIIASLLASILTPACVITCLRAGGCPSVSGDSYEAGLSAPSNSNGCSQMGMLRDAQVAGKHFFWTCL